MSDLDNLDEMDFAATGTPLEIPHPWQSVIFGMLAFTILTVVSWLLIAQYIATRPYDLVSLSDQTAAAIENFLVNHNIPLDQISASDPVLIEAPKAHYYQQNYIVHLPSHINPASLENTLERRMRSDDLVVTDYIEGADIKGLTISYGEFIFANISFIRLTNTSALNEAVPARPTTIQNTSQPGISLPKVNPEVLPEKMAEPEAEPDAPKNTEAEEAAVSPAPVTPKKDYTGWVPAGKRRENAATPAPEQPDAPADDIQLARAPSETMTDPEKAPSNTSTKKTPAKLAIIVDDGGYGGALTDTILDLDNRLTLSILPNTPHGSAIAKLGKERGFEIMLHMPMENTDDDLKHPGQINVDMSEEEIIRLTKDALSQIPEAVGVNNHTGSKYTTDPKAMALFLNVIKDLDLYFVDSKTTTETSAYEMSKAFGLASAERDLFLDHKNEEAEIRHRFREVVELAKEEGHAIAICHFRPITAEVLKDLVPTLEAQGITLVPASELVQ